MAESLASSFVESLLAAPVGVTLLDRLEARFRNSRLSFDCLSDSIPDAVARATESMSGVAFGWVLKTAIQAGTWLTGPWVGRAPENLALAYRHAASRRPIAEALVERFRSELHQPADGSAQQWWEFESRLDDPARIQQLDYEVVYGNGEFTFGGNWTATDPPAEILDTLASAWEMDDTVSRWRLPVRPDARVWSIDRPEDWVRLVESYPKVVTRPHFGWELPGPNQHRRNISDLLDVAGQRGARASIKRHVLPDWRAVADDVDGVHLSWAGYLTSEGYVADLAGGGVTMLRYWFSERTLWLNDVFETPAFIDFLTRHDRQSDTNFKTRKTEDLRRLNIYFGRLDSSE